jgi:hypothetical protein
MHKKKSIKIQNNVLNLCIIFVKVYVRRRCNLAMVGEGLPRICPFLAQQRSSIGSEDIGKIIFNILIIDNIKFFSSDQNLIFHIFLN